MNRVNVFLIVVALIAGMVGCVDVEFEINPDSGEVLETITLTSGDEMLTVTIPEGTIALDKDGNPLLTLSVDNDPDPPAPPEDAHIIGLAYDLDPSGATFDPAMTFTWEYSPADIPEGVDEEDLVIAYYDEAAGEWVILESDVDTATNTIEASVSHLTTFATVAVPPVQYNLTISSTGGGNVTTPGEGSFTYDEGTVVNLVATPDVGYQFVNWTGNVGTIVNVNAAITAITVNGNYSITADFEEIPPIQYDLTISSTAGGSVQAPGEGTFTYNTSTIVTLVAIPLSGYYFVNWTGDVSTIANVNHAVTTITMTNNCSITANFLMIPVTYYTLTVAVSGNGSTSPGVGQHNYVAGTVVSLSATPASDYCLVNWSGDVSTIGNIEASSTTITMKGDYSITANFGQQEPVYFADPNLEAVIRQAINKSEGPICPSDLKGLTELNAQRKNISGLTGLEHCTSMTELWLNENQISDISALASLTSLTWLDLYENQIADISPLATLTGLTQLQLRDNQISNISPLVNLTNLTQLYLSGNQISDISPVANLTNLALLSLGSNQISDISPVAGLTNLYQLSVGSNQISNISPVANLINLTHLHLRDNPVSDISPIAGLTKLYGLDLRDTQISDISPLANVTSLDWVDLRDNQISDISAVGSLIKLDWLWISNNQISDISPLNGLINTRHFYLEHNQISDISPLVQNEGLGWGCSVWLTGNPLSADSINIYIPELQARDVHVDY